MAEVPFGASAFFYPEAVFSIDNESVLSKVVGMKARHLTDEQRAEMARLRREVYPDATDHDLMLEVATPKQAVWWMVKETVGALVLFALMAVLAVMVMGL